MKQDVKSKEPTVDELILQYRTFRTKIEEIENKAAELVKPFKEGMEIIENYLSQYMHQVKLKSLPTENGTAYQTTVTSIKILNREQFIDWAYKNHKDLLQVSCNKTALKIYEDEKNPKPYPPNIEVTKIKRVNIRGK